MLTVDLRTAMVRDDETGLSIASSGLGGLASKMIELRAPLWLNEVDAASIALRIPRMLQALQTGCKIYTGGAFHSSDSIVGISCQDERPENSPSVAIDLRTGAVTDPRTGTAIGTPEAARLASKLLAVRLERRTELRTELDSACSPL